MANYVNASALAPYPLTVDPDEKPAQIVKRMKEHWQRELKQVLYDKPDIIVLPELCDTPVIHSPDSVQLKSAYLAERGEQMLDFFCEAARNNRCYIVYSAQWLLSDGTKRNRSQMIDRSGNVIETYDKQFPTAGEMQGGTLPGTELPIVECDFGRVAMVICYDMVFDELRAKVAKEKPDLIAFSSLGHYGLHANYWALSCRAHMVSAVARFSADIYSPLGDVIESSSRHSDVVTRRINLDGRVVQRFPAKKRVGRHNEIKKKYGNKVKIKHPDAVELGSYLFSSETDEFTIDEVIDEMNMQTLDDFLDEVRKVRSETLE